jgi:ribonuclease HII
VGIDEAGRGPLCGPVVAAAAVYRQASYEIPAEQAHLFDLIRDSKTLSAQQREKIFSFILENFHVGVGLCDHATIDRINILQASFLAMKKAISDLRRSLGHTEESDWMVVLDGKLGISNLSLNQRAVPGGDKYIKSISAASIVAKVTRDRLMLELHSKYPQYGFDKHKGYGTKFHIEMLEKYGPCEIHRRSFEPVKTLAKKTKGC